MGNVTLYKVDFTTDYDKWNEFRLRGLGASNVPAVLGYDEYKCNLELFYEKIGMPTFSFDSLGMFAGLESEPMIAKFWSHWGGDMKSLVENLRNKHIVRECIDIKSYAINSDRPYLFASTDRIIKKYGAFNTDGALEMKNTQRHILDKYENKIVTAHLIQNLTQVFTHEFEFGEVAYYLDNKSFDVVQLHDINPYGELIEQIQEEIKIFWDKVLVGRGLWTTRADAERNHRYRQVAELDNEIASIEPSPQNTDVYLKFLTEKFKERKLGINIKKGTPDMYKVAKTHKDIKAQIKLLEQDLITEEVKLKVFMGDSQRVDFDKGMGTLSWSKAVNGNRPFLNKVI